MKLIDISHELSGDTPLFPGDLPTRLTQYKDLEKDRYSAYLLETGLHTGTHVDVPMHLVPDGRTAADFPLDCFAGKGVLLDVRGEAVISMKGEYESLIDKGDIVLLFTGFGTRYRQPEYFTGHPVVGDELAAFLLAKEIKMLGMDMPAPDYPPFSFHRELLRNGILVLENLTNLQSLAGIKDFHVMALPLKLTAEASPVRAVCIV